jgi:hypothetical protein
MTFNRNEFSCALSHALCRLQNKGIITFPPKRSDELNFTSFASVHNKESVSEIRYMQGVK